MQGKYLLSQKKNRPHPCRVRSVYIRYKLPCRLRIFCFPVCKLRFPGLQTTVSWSANYGFSICKLRSPTPQIADLRSVVWCLGFANYGIHGLQYGFFDLFHAGNGGVVSHTIHMGKGNGDHVMAIAGFLHTPGDLRF